MLAPSGAFAAGAALAPGGAWAAALAALAVRDERTPAQIAADEDFWVPIQAAFAVDRSYVNLNNGGVCPAPAVVLEAMARHVAFSNHAPSYSMWRVLQPKRPHVRAALARHWGVSPDEIALTRNASESLQICQFGFDLEPGDEVLTTDQDYPRMISTFQQRARREGVKLVQFPLPVPCEDDDEIVRRFEERITARTRLILVCHMINLTGQVLPVRKVVQLARQKGIPVIVDGAHALAHVPFKLSELDCDYYGASLHKWLNGPIGTGLLYVRRERIAGLWPLMAAPPGRESDITKFEEVGTYPEANGLAVAEALAFHQAIGDERKLARLIWLRDRWAVPLSAHERIVLHTSLRPGYAGGIATVQVRDVDSQALHAWLWERRGLWTTPIAHPQFVGLRISPGIYTTPAEVDRFVEAVEHVLAHGLS